MPDEELLTLAEQGKLSQPETLRAAGRADAEGPEGGGLHRELRRPVARPARHRRHRARATSSTRSTTTCSRCRWSRRRELFFDEVLKNDLSLTNFVASDFTMLNGRLAKHYGIPGVDGLGVPQGDAAAGQPPRRRADDGERAEGDGQRHDDLAGPARGVGARPHPGHAAAQAARWTCRPSSRTSAAPRRSASNWPSTGRSPRARAATPRSTRRGSPWRASTSSAAGATTTGASARASRSIVDGRTMPYLKGPKVDPADVLPDGRAVREHRRVQATAAEGQGPARPRPGREAADLRHRRRARDGRPGRRSRRSSRKVREQELRLPDAGPRDRAEQVVSEQVSRRATIATTQLRPRGLSHETHPPPLPPRRRRVAGPAAGSTPARRRALRPRPRKPPRRMVCICTPLGLHPPYFFPEKAGKDYELTPYLEVLKDFRDDFTVISGLSHPDVEPGSPRLQPAS